LVVSPLCAAGNYSKHGTDNKFLDIKIGKLSERKSVSKPSEYLEANPFLPQVKMGTKSLENMSGK
jgi:hypothetical protein